MKDPFRILLGLITVTLLLPVLAIAAPGVFEAIWPGDAQPDSTQAVATSAASEETPSTSIELSKAEKCTSVFCEIAGEAGEPGPTHLQRDSTVPTTIAEADESKAVDVSHPAEHATTTSKPKASATQPPTTHGNHGTHPPTTGSGGGGANTQGTITGDACPCTVTGTATLAGKINLKGDLMVMGGTLVARPGVDLNGNGFQIMFMNGGRADFQGTKVFTWSGDGSNANLSRDINFRNLRRIMFHQGAGPSTLKYFTVSDTGTSALGDYPIHFHLNGNSTRGTIVEGVVVVNGRHHAFVPHGSHGITFKDTIAKNITEAAYWWDPAGTNNCGKFRKFCTTDNSNDIVYDHALVDGANVGSGLGMDSQRGSGFVLGAGSGNVVRNSVAINITGSVAADCSGFQWPEDANQNQGGNSWTAQNLFSRNPSGCHGIFVWQNDENPHVIDGFSGSGIDHGAYGNHYDYRNVSVPYLEIHATGWSMQNSHVGHAETKKHVAAGTVTFTNVTFDSFVVNNATDSGNVPATYVLNGTNLTCANIGYAAVVPGTRVTIDGVDC